MNIALNTGLQFIPIVGHGQITNMTNIGGASTKGAATGSMVFGSDFDVSAAVS
jgi:hypothetical protein